MESVSIAVTFVMLLFVSAYSGIIKVKLRSTAVKIGFWIMFTLFILNTVGNVLSNNALERFLFTPLTMLLSLFCFRLAAYGHKEEKDNTPDYV